MDELAKSDIFFLVTTVSVICVTAFVLTILVYILRIVRDFKRISGKIVLGSDTLAGDISAARDSIRHGVISLINFFRGGAKRPRPAQKRRSKE